MNIPIYNSLVAYDILHNEILRDKLSHAYLIDENNNSQADLFVNNFIKEIYCNDINDDFQKKLICKKIDEGKSLNVYTIKPAGRLIKKNQILDLQKFFSRSSINDKKLIYIIKDCDKMTSEASNSMLKFLEEPNKNIIAILMSNNINNLLPTIKSRCQIIKLGKINDLSNINFIEIAFKFIIDLIENGKDLYLKKDCFWQNKDVSIDRDSLVNIFDYMIDIYTDTLKLKNKNNNIRYTNYTDYMVKLEQICSFYDSCSIINKINYLINIRDSIKFNVNINLLMDSVILNLSI